MADGAADIVIVSDVHLGTRSCQAERLERYLDRVSPRQLILNGDIVDLREWGGYWPDAHSRVVRRLLALAEGGCDVVYVAGNHDALLRLITDRAFANVRVVDRLDLVVDGLRLLVVHGDRIEHALPMHPTLRRVACVAFRAIRFADRVVNNALRRFSRHRMRLLRGAKHLGRGHIEAYDDACAAYAAAEGYDGIIVGHIHRPRCARLQTGSREILYLNSGDWVDHASALEHGRDGWQVLQFLDDAPRLREHLPTQPDAAAT